MRSIILSYSDCKIWLIFVSNRIFDGQYDDYVRIFSPSESFGFDLSILTCMNARAGILVLKFLFYCLNDNFKNDALLIVTLSNHQLNSIKYQTVKSF